jgi:hypothetical protein
MIPDAVKSPVHGHSGGMLTVAHHSFELRPVAATAVSDVNASAAQAAGLLGHDKLVRMAASGLVDSGREGRLFAKTGEAHFPIVVS